MIVARRCGIILAAIACAGDGEAGTRIEQAFIVGMLMPEYPFIVKYDGIMPAEPIVLAYSTNTKTFATFESRWLVSGADTVEIKLADAPNLVSGTNRIPLRVKVLDRPVDETHPVVIQANPSDETKVSIFVTGSGTDHAPGTYKGSVTILFDSK